MLKKVLSVTVVLAICLTLGTVMPLVDAADVTGFEGLGTEGSPYLIKSSADMQRLAYIVNTEKNDCSGLYFEVTQNIVLTQYPWVPIGACTDIGSNPSAFTGTAFCGIFDGGNKEISMLFISARYPDLYSCFSGLFGYLGRSGVIKNLKVNSNINSGYFVGGIVGWNNGGTIENCSNAGTVKGSDNVGGIVGYSSGGTINNCSNSGTISGAACIGGIVGQDKGSRVYNSSNSGKISGYSLYIGGIVGMNDGGGSVNNCSNSGEVDGSSNIYMSSTNVGGIAGWTYGTIANCSNFGTISGGKESVGGVVGRSNSLMGVGGIYNCFNSGTISSIGKNVGGVVGSNSNIVSNCFNSGTVSSTGEENIGGIAGYHNTNNSIKNSYYLDSTASTGVGLDDNGSYIDSECRKPELSFSSGEVAYLLQSGQDNTGVQAWGQRLTTEGEHDDIPALTQNEAYRVLKVTFMVRDKVLTAKYANPDAVLETPEGYTAGWTTEQGGETAEFYDTVAVNNDDIILYAVPGSEPEPQYPEYDPPQPIEGLIYDRTDQKLIVPGSAANGIMVYKLDKEQETDANEPFIFDNDYSEDIPTAVDAGEYTVWYMVIGNEGYENTDAKSLTVTIAKADPVPPDTDLKATVGQTLKDVEPQLPEGYVWADNTLSVGDVGENSFAAIFTPKDTKNFNTLYDLTLTVKVTDPDPQNPEFTPPQARELVYNSEAQRLITPGNAINGTMVYKLGDKGEQEEESEGNAAAFALLLPDAEGYSDDIPVGINAGEYIVWYKVIGDDGYNDIEPHSLTVTIAKADPIPPEINLNATVGQTLADIESQLPEGYAWVDNAQSVGNVGTNYFPAIFTPADTKNFNTLKLDLPVKVISIEVTPPKARTGLVYDRTPHELITAGSAANGTMVYKVEAENKETGATTETALYNLLSNDMFSYETLAVDPLADNDGYSERIPTGTDAGKYTVWYKVIDGDGGNITAPVSLTVEIAKADPVPPATDLKATVGQTLADVKLPEGYAWIDSTQKVGSVGTHSFAATFTPRDTGNFNTLSLMLDVKVTEKPAEETTTTTAAAPVVTTTTAVTTPEAATTTVTAPAETTTAATTTTPPEVTTEPPSTTNPPPDVTGSGDVGNGSNGDTILSVKDAGNDVPAEDKQAIKAVLEGTGYTVGMYLNIDLIKLVDGQQVKITESSSPVSVTVKIPEALRIKNRIFAVVRVHNGKADILNDRDSDPNTVTVLSDRFSTYALIYRDSASTDEDRSPNTGIVPLVPPLAAATITVVVSRRRK